MIGFQPCKSTMCIHLLYTTRTAHQWSEWPKIVVYFYFLSPTFVSNYIPGFDRFIRFGVRSKAWHINLILKCHWPRRKMLGYTPTLQDYTHPSMVDRSKTSPSIAALRAPFKCHFPMLTWKYINGLHCNLFVRAIHESITSFEKKRTVLEMPISKDTLQVLHARLLAQVSNV